MDQGANRIGLGQRIADRSHHDRHCGDGKNLVRLAIRDVHLGCRFTGERLLHVGNDSDDLHPGNIGFGYRAKLYVLPDGRPAGEKGLRKAGVDDRDGGRSIAIAIGNPAAGNQWNAQRFQVPGTDSAVAADDVFAGRSGRTALNVEVNGRSSTGYRQKGHASDGPHAGQSCDLLEEPVVERQAYIRIAIGGGRPNDIGNQEVVGGEAR